MHRTLRPLALSFLLTFAAFPLCAADSSDTTKPAATSDTQMKQESKGPDFGDLPQAHLSGTHLSLDSTWWFVIETRHRVHAKFRQVDTVLASQSFELGDGEYRANIIDFYPQLSITVDGKYLHLSDTLYQPAARIQVVKGDSTVQTSWGFHYVEAPHFMRDNLFAFKLVEFRVDPRYIQPAKKE